MKAKSPIKGYWARKGGGFIARDGIPSVKGKRGAAQSSSNSGGGRRTIHALLVEHAAGYGFYNGVKVKK